MERGGCANEKCLIDSSEIIQIDGKDYGNTTERQKQCLDLCHSIDGATGCELVWSSDKKGCYAYKQSLTQVKKTCLNEEKEECSCWIFDQCKQDWTGEETLFISFSILNCIIF